jgi:formate dehydrogenase subunit gamma
MTYYEPWSAERASAIITEFKGMDGSTLPILHEIQHTFGFVPEPVIPMIADALNLSRAEVFGTVSFYHDFRHELPGRHIVKLCRAEACQAAGADRLMDRAEQRLGIKLGETTPDHRVTMEPIYCLGLCATAPADHAAVDHGGRLDDRKLDAILTEAQS